MDNVYSRTDPAIVAALSAELKGAYCSSRKVGVDRMGCAAAA